MPPAPRDLYDLLAALNEHPPESDTAKPLVAEVLAKLTTELKEDLRNVLFSKGVRVDTASASRQLTELLQNFSAKVLAKCPTNLARVQTRTALLYYVAKALSKMLLSHYRTKRRRSEHHDALTVLAELREKEFEQEFADTSVGGNLEAVLEQLERWDQSGDPKERLWAQAIRYRFVIGMRTEQIDGQWQAREKVTFDQLGEALGVSAKTAERRLKEALDQLRQLLETS